ncbi:MAG: fibronectin type III domain-containing protein [Planctomycetota bacterium]|nr:fibronectin type III domain-containing protein [Planctomycetota bacterium]
MPNQTSLEQIELAELTQAVDDGRVAADPFKMIAATRTLLDARLADLKTKDSATLTTEAGRATSSANVRTALEQLRTLLRDGFNFVQGLGSFAITDADRLGVFTAYGWESGLVGDFTDARIESLANQAITATPGIADPAHRYPAALLALITTQLGIVNTNQPLATGGTAQAATDARDAALELLQLINARVRFFYCNASDDLDQTAELVKIGRQPRRASGEAQSQPLPAAPGAVTFAAVALTLTAPAMPDHATTLRAYRRVAGGTAELAGSSPTTTVSVVELGPLTSGVTYEFWLVGRNSRGDGPESNHITHIAT